MNYKTKIIGAVIGIAATVIGGVIAYKNIDAATTMLNSGPAYSQSQRLEDAQEYLGRAASALVFVSAKEEATSIYVGGNAYPSGFMYTKEIKPPVYPNTLKAKNAILAAIELIGDTGTIDDRLKEIEKALPAQTSAETYQSKPVDENTFVNDKSGIQGAIAELDAVRESLLSQIPEGAQLQLDWATLLMYASGFTCVGFMYGTGNLMVEHEEAMEKENVNKIVPNKLRNL